MSVLMLSKASFLFGVKFIELAYLKSGFKSFTADLRVFDAISNIQIKHMCMTVDVDCPAMICAAIPFLQPLIFEAPS